MGRRLLRPPVIAASPNPGGACSSPDWLAGLLIAVVAVISSTATAEPSRFIDPSEVKSGALLIAEGDGARFIEAPRLGTDIAITVSGPTARSILTQRFRNPTDRWVEATYLFPLAEGAAVDTLKMIVGDRVIIGDIKERQQAKAVYEAAKAEGRKASLIEQERPNMFTSSIANLGPGETVIVQIEYQEKVARSGSEFSLRVPLVVGPRYIPEPIVQTVKLDGGSGGWTQTLDPVPDRDRIAAPVLDPRKHAPINPVTLSVRLSAGFPLGEVKSHHHAVKADAGGADTTTLTLAEGATPADRDFELTWKPKASRAPAVGLFKERVGTEDYVLAFVTPPDGSPEATTPKPREVIFVIDNSGSMSGPSMDQAKASLVLALRSLTPTDRFNVVRFDDTLQVLFPDTVAADANAVAVATRFVAGLDANGGTEMVPAMDAALTDPRPTDAAYLRQVVFLTDGAIGNEDQLFATIAGKRGRSRIFMVGIGSAPNTFLMTRAAETGRGAFTHIGSPEQVEERMKALFAKLENPAVTSLSLSFTATTADASPAPLPDLFRGEPLVVAAKLGALKGDLVLEGFIGDQPWKATLPLAGAADGTGLSKLWARRKIDDAEASLAMNRLTPDVADKRILDLALAHHIVSRKTSLLAVDATPTRPEGARLTLAELPLDLPAGWDFDKVFGADAAHPAERTDNGAETSPDRAAAEGTLIPTSARKLVATPVAIGAQPGVVLPRTASDAELRLLIGLVLMLIALACTGLGLRVPSPRR